MCHEQALGATYIVPARCQAKLDIASFWRSWFSGWSVPNTLLLDHLHTTNSSMGRMFEVHVGITSERRGEMGGALGPGGAYQ